MAAIACCDRLRTGVNRGSVLQSILETVRKISGFPVHLTFERVKVEIRWCDAPEERSSSTVRCEQERARENRRSSRNDFPGGGSSGRASSAWEWITPESPIGFRRAVNVIVYVRLYPGTNVCFHRGIIELNRRSRGSSPITGVPGYRRRARVTSGERRRQERSRPGRPHTPSINPAAPKPPAPAPPTS